MFRKYVLLLALMGIVVGLSIGILDSLLHSVGFEKYKILNSIVFLLFFVGIYYSLVIYRDKLTEGFMSWGNAFKNIIWNGLIASLTIACIRFVYLKHIANIDIDIILDNTEQTMLNHYSLYKQELINNRLEFIQFSYDPFVSSTLYFIYYFSFVVIFGLIAAFFIRKIDRNIAL